MYSTTTGTTVASREEKKDLKQMLDRHSQQVVEKKRNLIHKTSSNGSVSGKKVINILAILSHYIHTGMTATFIFAEVMQANVHLFLFSLLLLLT